MRDRPHKKFRDKCLSKLKELTSRSRGQGLDAFRRKLKAYIIHIWVDWVLWTFVDGEIRLENRRMAETSHQKDLLEAVEKDLDAI